MAPFADLLICLRFLSRLPVPATARERARGAGGFAAAAAMAPVAGLVVALPAILVLRASSLLGLPPILGAILAVASLVGLTGALHEDALADCADGFGGGRSRERKLAIMRDSAIGAFGATAIAFSLLLRCGAIAAAIGSARGGVAVVVAAMLSRAACFLPLALLPPVHADGAGAAAAVDRRRVLAACLLAGGLAVLFAGLGAEAVRAGIAALAAPGAALAVTTLACRQIGGQTGDVAGTTQQAAEIAVLLVFAAGAG